MLNLQVETCFDFNRDSQNGLLCIIQVHDKYEQMGD